MRITAKKTNTGTEVSIFVPSSEINLKLQSHLTCNEIKEFRVKRNFKKSFSPKQLETIELISSHIIHNFNAYKELFEQLGSNHILEKLKIELIHHLDSYQFNSIELVSEIIFAIFFNTKTSYSIETLRKRYSLDVEKDLLVSLIGTFGYGKTTLIKKLLGFDDDYCFLLVDKGRTTISNSIIRALIVIKDENNKELIWSKNPNTDSFELVPLETYQFKNSISLNSCEYIYKNIITFCLNQAFIVYCKDPSKTKKVLKKFISYTKCNLDGLFGDISNTENSFYSHLLSEFDIVYKSLSDQNEDISHDFSQNKFLYSKFEHYYNTSINNAILEIENKTNKSIQYDKDTRTISFELTSEEISDGETIDNCYSNFTSNRLLGNGLRILVNEIYTEIDFDVTQFINNDGNFVIPNELYNDSSNEKTCKYHSIVFTDTVGCAHLQTSSESDSLTDSISNQDIIANAALLNESDLIILLENSTKSMSDDIKGQLFTLENLGCKDKVIICYSFYNQFVKMDIPSDEYREDSLNELFHKALLSLYPQNPHKANRIYQSFTCGLGPYEKDSHIVYLKGLVKRQDILISKESKTNNRRRNSKTSSSNTSTNSIAENKLAHKLNANFEDCNACLQELFNKMILVIENINFLKKNSFTIDNNSSKEEFAIKFCNSLYPEFQKHYMASQSKIYKRIIPAWNTSKALCDNASNGNAYFSGSSLTLAPLNDALAHMLVKVSSFFENIPPIELMIDDDGNAVDAALNTDFIIDQIKTKFNQELTDYYKLILVTSNKLEWGRYGTDYGSGVQWRRSNNIFNLIEKVYSMQTVQSYTLQLLRDVINQIVDSYNTN